MHAVITVIGKDTVGILAKVSEICAKYNTNVVDVTQTVMKDMFAMIMLTDISKINSDLSSLTDSMNELSKQQNLKIHVMHENIFNSMHTI